MSGEIKKRLKHLKWFGYCKAISPKKPKQFKCRKYSMVNCPDILDMLGFMEFIWKIYIKPMKHV